MFLNGSLLKKETKKSRDKKGKGKGAYTVALYGLETHHRATERHLPYESTQCYLPPNTGERAPP